MEFFKKVLKSSAKSHGRYADNEPDTGKQEAYLSVNVKIVSGIAPYIPVHPEVDDYSYG